MDSAFTEDVNAKKIAKIQKAMSLGVRLEIVYLSTTDARVTERQVLPKEIKQERNHGYLIGHCCLRNEERSFRIDSILHLEVV
jgi:predicted DNA-binding transcriptional regulator YafY